MPFSRRQTTHDCVFTYVPITFCSCDLDLDPMTLIYKLDLDVLKTYLYIKNDLSRSRL